MGRPEITNPKKPKFTPDKPPPVDVMFGMLIAGSIMGGIAAIALGLILDLGGWLGDQESPSEMPEYMGEWVVGWVFIVAAFVIVNTQVLPRVFKPIKFPTFQHREAHLAFEALNPEDQSRARPAYDAVLEAAPGDDDYQEVFRVWDMTLWTIYQANALEKKIAKTPNLHLNQAKSELSALTSGLESLKGMTKDVE